MSVGWVLNDNNKERQAKGPTTMRILEQQQFNQFVGLVAITLGKQVTDEFTEAVGTIILHASPDMGEFDPAIIGNKVAKMLANQYAFEALQTIKAARAAASKPVDTKPEGTPGVTPDIQNS